jgi:small basic protein
MFRMHAVRMKINQKYDQNIFVFSFTTNCSLERKALPTFFLTFGKNID